MAAKTEASVADLMTSGVITCAPDTDLGSVAATLSRAGVHAIFVREKYSAPSGVVTDFDLLAGEWLADDAAGLTVMRAMTAGEMMTSPIETISSRATASEAAARLRELHLSRLLVTNDWGSAVGVISVSDLVAPLWNPSSKRRCVEDVMSRAILTCLAQTPVEAACRAMAERRSRSIVVVDNGGRAAGVITGNDLLSLYERSYQPATVEHLMTPPITCTPQLALSEAAHQMVTNEVHRLVVVDSSGSDGAPIGIVSTSDIVAEMAAEHSVWRHT